VTTGWDSLRDQPPGIGLLREAELREKGEFWGSMVGRGSGANFFFAPRIVSIVVTPL